ncbi:MAG TPA: hypothetical protein VMT38_08595 [Terracidiphilus sp.]|nr:hypothetical protein [Terracidiphilus sp.]
MRSFFRFTRIAALLCLTGFLGTVAASAAPKDSPGTIVITFKDGHRQTFNLADIDRVEIAGGVASTNEESAIVPSRGRFLGKWECGDGSGNTFYITLNEDGTAFRTIGDKHGRWEYVDGEARVTWDDGRRDAIRKYGSQFLKFAYGPGKVFTDDPDNVAHARKTTGGPI